MRKYNGKHKGKKVSALARSGFQQQRAAVLLPRYLVWIKSYLFVYVSLSAVCTLSRRCTTICSECMCAHVFGTYMSFSLPLTPFSLPLSPFILLFLSLFRSREHSCIVSDKQPHMHTITASERIRFADTRRVPYRNHCTKRIKKKPRYRRNFIILDETSVTLFWEN